MQITKLVPFMYGCGERERRERKKKSLLFNEIQIPNVPLKQHAVVNLDRKKESSDIPGSEK